MPIERRWKLSVAGMAKRSFRRVSEGQDGRSERPARWHGQRPDASTTTPSRMPSPGFLSAVRQGGGGHGRPRYHQPNNTEQDARIAGCGETLAFTAAGQGGGGHGRPRYHQPNNTEQDARITGCGETLAFTAAGPRGGGGHGWPRHRKVRTRGTDARLHPSQPAFRQRSACPAWH
jgi:hypothetical protein